MIEDPTRHDNVTTRKGRKLKMAATTVVTLKKQNSSLIFDDDILSQTEEDDIAKMLEEERKHSSEENIKSAEGEAEDQKSEKPQKKGPLAVRAPARGRDARQAK